MPSAGSRQELAAGRRPGALESVRHGKGSVQQGFRIHVQAGLRAGPGTWTGCDRGFLLAFCCTTSYPPGVGWRSQRRDPNQTGEDDLKVHIPVVDFHAHLGNWGQYRATDDPGLYLRCMDNAGIDVACLSCHIYGDARRGNDLVAHHVRKWPDRFVGVAFVTPHYPDEIVAELKRCFDQLGMKFIKVYPLYVRVALDDPLYFPIYHFANQRKLAILSHATDYFDPPTISIYDRFQGLVSRFPEVTWVMAHSGRGRSMSELEGSGLEETMKTVRDFPNVYLETCGSGLHNGGIEYPVRESRADRILFGTDMPLLDASQQLAKVIVSQISDEEKKLVLGGNAIRLLGLEL